MTNLLILADGGGGIGLGHIMRCLAIKKAWSYGDSKLLVHMEGDAFAPDGAIAFNWLTNLNKLKQYASTNPLVLIDSYRPNESYFQQIKSIFLFVATLDDYNRIVYPVDLLICPGVYGKTMNYSNQSAITAGGAEYVILRPEIIAVNKIQIKDKLETILLTLGGSQKNSTIFQKIIDSLDNLPYQLIVITANDKIAKELSSKNALIYGKLDSVKMAEIMSYADIAISSSGQTLNEFSWLGIPTFTIKTGEDQHQNWDYYHHHNLSIGSALADSHNLQSILINTLKNETVERRLKRSNKLQKLLTATGANRICSLIKNRGIVNE